MAKTKEQTPILTKAEIKAKAIETKKAEQNYTELHDVVDTRTRQFHSVAVVKDAKYFVPVEEWSE